MTFASIINKLLVKLKNKYFYCCGDGGRHKNKVRIWKCITYIYQNRMTQNVNNFEALTLNK